MEKLIYTCIFVFAVMTLGKAQKIDIQEVGNKYKYSLDEKPIELKEMVRLMKDYPEALSKVNEVRTMKVISYVPAFAGGWILGRAIGKGISGNHEDALIDEIGIGTGLIGLSLLLNSGTKKKINRAVTTYNSSLILRSENDSQTSSSQCKVK